MARKCLRLFILGPLQIQLGEKDLGKRISAKGRALLAYLALTGRPHSRSTLAGLLWGESPEKNARRNLRVELSKLRKVVGEVVTATHETLAVEPSESVWLDAAEFERLIATQDLPEGQRRALALYRGDFLEGLQVREAPIFEEWVLLERERLRQLAMGGLERLIRWSIEQEHFEDGIQDARQLLTLDPWLESAQRNLMWMLARSGQRSAALSQYETCRQILAEELGVEPASETTELCERIKAGTIGPAEEADFPKSKSSPTLKQPSQPTAPPNNLPAQTTSFVGRARELRQIQELLADSDCRLLTLIGPGGIGKTRLAMQAASRWVVAEEQAFKDGVYFVPLAEVQAPESVIPAIGDALEIAFSGGTTPKEQLGNYLREKELLLVLDSFEHLVAGAESLVELIKIAPGLKIMVTSRERIDLYEEWLLDVPGLPYPDIADAPDFEDFAAVQLFYQRARRINLGFTVSQERPAIARICQLVTGMPLGIELAAAWVRGMSCAQIADQLEQNLDSLAITARNLPARQRSLRAAFSYSWDLLQVGEREAFIRMMVFHGGFTAEAADQVAGIDLQVLSSLVDKSLLQRTPAGRFEVHATLRTFGEEKLQADLSLQEAHALYFATLIQDQESALLFGDTSAIEAIHTEIENLRVGWDWATAQLIYPVLEKMITGLGSFYRLRGLFEVGIEAFDKTQRALQNILGEDERVQLLLGRLQVWQGEYLDKMGRFREAVGRFETALDIFRAQEDRRALASTQAALGFSISGLGDNERALQNLQESLEALEAFSDRYNMAIALHHLGIVKTQIGERNQGLLDIEKSMELFRAVGDRRGLSNSMSILANIHIALGNYDRARELHDECQGIFDEIGDPMGKAHGLHSLSLITFRQEDYETSESFSRQALAIFSQFGVPYGISKALNNLGEIEWVKGDFHRSKEHFMDALTASRNLPSLTRHRGTGNVLRGLGRTEVALGELDLARDHLYEAMDIFIKGQFIDSALDTFPYIAEYFLAAGEEAFAVQMLSYAMANPVTEDFARQEAQVVLKRLEGRLDSMRVERSRRAGRDKSPSEMMAEILTRLA